MVARHKVFVIDHASTGRAISAAVCLQVQPCFMEATNGRPGSKQVVSYHFHPVLPFVLCLLHTQQQALQICIALRT